MADHFCRAGERSKNVTTASLQVAALISSACHRIVTNVRTFSHPIPGHRHLAHARGGSHVDTWRLNASHEIRPTSSPGARGSHACPMCASGASGSCHPILHAEVATG